MAMATAMFHSGKNPLHKVRHHTETVYVAKSLRQRRLHKAFLRYHDADNWPLLREALKRMGRAELIGNGKHHLIPAWQPHGDSTRTPSASKHKGSRFRTQHAEWRGTNPRTGDSSSKRHTPGPKIRDR
jgi:hypothetical protein